ncbi:hypothetical protein M8C21_021393 [Ambrosia artemisiifolia]|uniref:Uncharacterized protein n=1 Tax=Ambrosia artemisiifolia TaxID=4212 RepID=A0AAD5GUZ8_AMBAR|nr:hypothetical protein M8C21_021393 [Ambrosia artemisiifolia]
MVVQTMRFLVRSNLDRNNLLVILQIWALETLVSALTPIAHANEVQPALITTDLLSRERLSISLL